jgi:hypothetical protein
MGLVLIVQASAWAAGNAHGRANAKGATIEFVYSVPIAPGQDVEERPEREFKLETPPRHWPSNRDVRSDEPGAWKPPRDRFDLRDARSAVVPAFARSLEAGDEGFGDVPKDVHIPGFVRMPLRVPGKSGAGTAGTKSVSVPCEVSVVQLGPRATPDSWDGKIKNFLLITSRGKMLFKKELGETETGAFANHYALSRVVTDFGKDPVVLLFTDFGGSSRLFMYRLFRVRADGVAQIWESDWEDCDGHSGSLQQGYGQSNFDFSEMRAGRANEFQVYTTSGCRRWMEPGDEELLKTKYTKRVYRWDETAKMFVRVSERSFFKAGR